MIVLTVLLGTITLAAPLILAALGGYLSERSGVANIALEGKMLISACVTCLAGIALGNAWAGLACGVGSAIALSLLHWLLTQKFALDHILSGMAINALAVGGANFLYQRFVDNDRVEGAPILPVATFHLGQAGIFQVSIYLVLAYLLPFLFAIYVTKTRAGLRLIAVGSDPDKARLVGLRPLRVRLAALIGAGVMTGLAGAMILSNVSGRYTDSMTAGRGYIALAALILGGWRPLPTLIACFAFALFEAIQVQLQGTHLFGANIPSEVWVALPYLATVIAMAGLLGRNRAPLGLGKP